MLNKKSVFKPKAAIRRPVPGPTSRGSQRPSTSEPSANSTPAPQDIPSSQPQPAQDPDSANGTPEQAGTLAPVQEEAIESAAGEPPQATITLVRTEIASEGSNQRADTTTPTGVPDSGTKDGITPEQPSSREISTVQETGSLETPVAGANASAGSGAGGQPGAVTILAATATSSEDTTSPTPPSTETPSIPPSETPASEQVQPTAGSTSEPASGPSEASKPKRCRKRAVIAATGEDSGEQNTAAPANKRPRKKAAPPPDEQSDQPAAPRATRSRKRSKAATENGEPENNSESGAGQSKGRPPRAQREATPPDAENVEIDITQVKMADLAKDMHIGKKFSLHDELMERERAKRLRFSARKKRQQDGEDGDGSKSNRETSAGTSASISNNSTQATPATTESAGAETPADGPSRATIGEAYQIIDGQIVLDHRSLRVDLHARAREEAGELVEVEENDFTHHTTSATYLRRNLKPQQWTDEETDLFYQALQAFGTDFDTICRMFKGKTRKHIKLKFNREERVNPARITAALVGQKTVLIDLEQYQRATGQEYETAEAIYAEQKRAEEEFEAKQKALEDEKAEEVRRKKEEVLAQLNSAVDGERAGGGDGGGDGKKGRKGGRKKKAPAVMGL
ncbi:hypothetical protein N657DRAFT_672133 [Parathielavia appendiculata]|uniref:Myb-like domain-containing protein n=1 Tax=Parathielavia appendiculata TaxID=2587402 RepID=A0AAN6TYG2_9PEZI|nr:hypothetical protein N657DRAFT_672133 [Parathielavia appendiculata]